MSDEKQPSTEKPGSGDGGTTIPPDHPYPDVPPAPYKIETHEDKDYERADRSEPKK